MGAILKEEVKKALQKFDERLTEKFLKSADEQEMTQTARILRNICPIKVHRVRKELAKEYGLEENETDKNCIECYFNKDGKCTRFAPCYMKQPGPVIASAILKTEHGADEE